MTAVKVRVENIEWDPEYAQAYPDLFESADVCVYTDLNRDSVNFHRDVYELVQNVLTQQYCIEAVDFDCYITEVDTEDNTQRDVTGELH